ncbi:MAG: RNA-binding transcriptional accessory protein [Flavobacteriales bacterium]|nr:RNA-binding transcriptional accessory protein [Flavobacteriales bacterium]
MSITHLINIPGATGKQIEATLHLLQDGATIPFIARYRKEATSGLDEVQIAGIKEQHDKLEELKKRKISILETIREQGFLTTELEKRIEETWDGAVLEDIYLPYKPKRKTKASVAREKGLEPLAGVFMKQELTDPEGYAMRFVKGEVHTVEEAIEGACHIMAEWMSEREGARNRMRQLFQRQGMLSAKEKKSDKEEAQKYRDYFTYSSPANRTPGHRLLAMVRGENEGFLSLSIEPPRDIALEQLDRFFIRCKGAMADIMADTVKDAYMRLLRPAMESETRRELLERAEDEAIEVFSKNLDQLLMAPPLGSKATLALDPGFRTGCKVVCLNAQGELKENTTIFPHPPVSKHKEAASKISQLIEAHKIDVVAIGDGTAGRETEQWIRKEVYVKRPVEIYMVNEAGASIYSASAVARAEFPDYDVTVRGAVSIGRRLMDPLSELVKIDPKSIGVGQYQHDVDQNKLKQKLQWVTERVVNRVGVDLNLASEHLLQYVSGLSAGLAKKIVDHRRKIGRFTSRKSLLDVSGLGPKAYEQCAGFLRIQDADDILDNSAIHPERYALVRMMAKDHGIQEADLLNGIWIDEVDLKRYIGKDVGLPTLEDICQELKKPGRDPRGKAKQFEFGNVSSIGDLREGMRLPGKVTNITKFGAFVDIGVKQDGLVHVSQMADRFVSDPMEVVQLGQVVYVRITELDIPRKRIGLSMKEN